MSKNLCIFIGWEPRCLESFKEALKEGIDTCLAMYSSEFEARTVQVKDQIELLCRQNSIQCLFKKLSVFNPAECWTSIYDFLKSYQSQQIVLDLTTMPRTVLWSALGILEYNQCIVEYAYATPISYGDNLTGNPLLPWIQPKQSGLPDLDKSIALVVSVGFDTDRTEQLIKYFSPKVVVMFGQPGQEYKSSDRCITSHLDEIVNKSPQCDNEGQCGSNSLSTFFYNIDSYSSDHGYSCIETQISVLLDRHNVLMSSLGPKPTAIAMYKLHKKYPQTALVYAPCRDISIDYSSGYKSRIIGKL